MINKLTNYSGYLKEGVWVVIGQVVSFSASIYGVKLLTGLMLPKEYGELSLTMTYTTLLSQLLFAPLSASSSRFYNIAKEKNEINKYAISLKYLLIFFSVLSFIISFIIGILLYYFNKVNLILSLGLALIFSITSGINMTITAIQIAARQRSLVAIIQGVDSWTKYLFAIFVVITIGAFTISVLIGYIISSILLLFFQNYHLRKIISNSKVSRDKDWEKKIWKYLVPFIYWGLFTWAHASSDKWALAFFSTSKNVGLYNALYQIGYFPISVAVGFGIQFLTPIFFQKAGDGMDLDKGLKVNRLSRKIILFTLTLTAIAFIISFIFHKQLLLLFFDHSEYVEISFLLPWLIMAGGIFACAQALSLEMMSKMQTSRLATIKIISSIIGIILNVVFAYYFNIKGLVVANIIFSVFYFTWTNYNIKKNIQY